MAMGVQSKEYGTGLGRSKEVILKGGLKAEDMLNR